MPKTAATKGTKKGMATTGVVRLTDAERVLRLDAIAAEERAGGTAQTVSMTKLDRQALAIGYRAIADGQSQAAA